MFPSLAAVSVIVIPLQETFSKNPTTFRTYDIQYFLPGPSKVEISPGDRICSFTVLWSGHRSRLGVVLAPSTQSEDLFHLFHRGCLKGASIICGTCKSSFSFVFNSTRPIGQLGELLVIQARSPGEMLKCRSNSEWIWGLSES